MKQPCPNTLLTDLTEYCLSQPLPHPKACILMTRASDTQARQFYPLQLMLLLIDALIKEISLHLVPVLTYLSPG